MNADKLDGNRRLRSRMFGFVPLREALRCCQNIPDVCNLTLPGIARYSLSMRATGTLTVAAPLEPHHREVSGRWAGRTGCQNLSGRPIPFSRFPSFRTPVARLGLPVKLAPRRDQCPIQKFDHEPPQSRASGPAPPRPPYAPPAGS